MAMLEAQVVQVVLPDGDVEARLASLDATSSSLVLKQVNLGNGGEVQVGGQAVVKLSSIGHSNASGKIVYLRAGGPSGPVLLELHFDSASVAQLWARTLGKTGKEASPVASPARSPASNGGRSIPVSSGRGSPASRGSPTGQGRGAGQEGAAPTGEQEANEAATATLRELVRQQEEQVRLLQEITSRKDEQLLKIQERLEDSLNMLQVGQETYAKQGVLLADQTKMITTLRGQLEGADSVVAACHANAAEAAAGRAAAGRAPAAPNAARSPAAAAMGSMARAQAAAAAAASGAGRGAQSSPAPSPGAKARAAAAAAAAAGNSQEDEEDHETVLAEQEAIVAKIQALDAEKGQYEAELMREQNNIFAELKELQGMMAELGLDLNDVTAAEA